MTLMLLLGACDNDSDNNEGSGGSAENGQVTSVTASVSPTTHTGLCPKNFKFTGVITTDGPCEVTYRWVHVPFVHEEKTIVFTAAGSKTVTYSWLVGSDIKTNEQWLDLIVSAPNQFMVTPPTSFKLVCAALFGNMSRQSR